MHAQGFQARAPLWLFSEGMEGAEGAQRVRVSYLPSASITAWSINPLPREIPTSCFNARSFLRVCLHGGSTAHTLREFIEATSPVLQQFLQTLFSPAGTKNGGFLSSGSAWVQYKARRVLFYQSKILFFQGGSSVLVHVSLGTNLAAHIG